jgi:integrase
LFAASCWSIPVRLGQIWSKIRSKVLPVASYDLSAQIQRENTRLDRCSLEQRGARIALRATLPDPVDPSRRARRRINIPLPAGPEHFRRMAALARDLDDELLSGTFHWQRWTPEALERWAGGGEASGVLTMAQLRAAIETTWGERHPGTEQAWHSLWGKKWAPLLRRLEPLGGLCSAERLCALLAELSPSSRKDAASVLSVVIQARRLPLDAEQIRAAGRGYGARELQPRDIPSDATLLSYVPKITQPHWRWMYCMLLTYGLRPHEIAHCSLRPDGVLDIAAGKTGERESWPCPEAWVVQLGLHEVHRPHQSASTVAKAAADALTSARSNGRGGRRQPVLPFGLYTLRHAYAIRLLQFGISSDVGARLMGHSVEIHNRTYRRWLNRQHMSELRQRLGPRFRGEEP